MQTHHKNEKNQQFEMNGQLVKQMVSETPHLFMITSLPSSEEAMIDDLHDKYAKENKLLHIIRGSEAEIKRLSELLDREKQRQSVSPMARKVDMFVCSCNGWLMVMEVT